MIVVIIIYYSDTHWNSSSAKVFIMIGGQLSVFYIINGYPLMV